MGNQDDVKHALGGCLLFAGIPEDRAWTLLTPLQCQTAHYGPEQRVLWEGESTDHIGVVLHGQGQSVKRDLEGRTYLVTLLNPGSLIGVLLAGSPGRPSPVTVETAGAMAVLWIPMERLLAAVERDGQAYGPLLRNLIHCLSDRALVLHDRNDCLLRPTLRDKIGAYLLQMQRQTGAARFALPLDRKALAQYLHADRSALSRELSAMQREGLIRFSKNQFEILHLR